MSQSDSFIDEVSEEIRRDRLMRFFRRYGWIVAAVLVVVIGGAAYWEIRRAGDRAAARDFGDAVTAALEAETPEGRREALLAIDATGARAAILAMLAAETAEGEVAETAMRGRLDQLAGDGDVPQVYGDLAQLKAAMLAHGTVPPAEILSRLEPLTIPGAPYRLLAMEQQAVARLAMGETEAALDTLEAILSDGTAPAGLQERARQMIVALGGSVEAV